MKYGERTSLTIIVVSGKKALVFYEALADFGKHRLYNNGSIYAEIHEDLAPQVINLFEKENYQVELRKDMQGKNRMIKAKPNLIP